MEGEIDEAMQAAAELIGLKDPSPTPGVKPLPPRPVLKLDLDEYRKTVLEESNKYRALHYAKPLVLDDKINAFAQEWAMNIAKTDKVVHRGPDTQKYGENLAVTTSIKTCPVKIFYDEIKLFEWYNPEKFECRYFTALVWRSAKRLGVGIAQSTTGKFYTVCNYDPIPNILGTYLENVKFKVDSVDVKLYHKQILERSNKHRRAHWANPLVLDDAISAYSQEWADKLAKNDKLERRPKKDQKFGENVFMGTEINEIWPTDYWHDESSEFDETAMEKESTLRFTQLVWKASKKLGVGVARSEQGKWYVVCNYDPPGNVPGKFKLNVKVHFDVSEFRKDLLVKINAMRADYHAPPLVIDDKINANAQRCAEKFADGKVEIDPSLQTCGVFHLGTNDLAVNHMTPAKDGENVIDWMKLEDNKAPMFTQTIWKATKKLGVGVAKRKNQYYLVTCFYPKGNLCGKFDENCKPK